MNPSKTNNRVSKKILISVTIVIIVVVCGYEVISLFLRVNNMGTLTITSTTPNAALSISQQNHQAAILGYGNASVHIMPGDYQVAAASNGKEATITVVVTKKRTTNAKIDPANQISLPSVENINFENFGTLITNGLTTSEESQLEELFFQYDHSANTVILEQGSFQNGPLNPSSPNPAITATFVAVIDGTDYDADISYQGFNSVQLTLYDTRTGNEVYNSTDGGD